MWATIGLRWDIGAMPVYGRGIGASQIVDDVSRLIAPHFPDERRTQVVIGAVQIVVVGKGRHVIETSGSEIVGLYFCSDRIDAIVQQFGHHKFPGKLGMTKAETAN